MLEALIPPMKVWVSGCTDWAFTEIWKALPVVERMVTAPSSESRTVPDVYVVSELRMAPRKVWVSGWTD